MTSPNSARKMAQAAFPVLTECEHCGAEGQLHRHHPDLDKPLEIIVLCVPCHVLEHQRNGGWGRRPEPPCPCRVCNYGFEAERQL